jgi:hypothetical protein
MIPHLCPNASIYGVQDDRVLRLLFKRGLFLGQRPSFYFCFQLPFLQPTLDDSYMFTLVHTSII